MLKMERERWYYCTKYENVWRDNVFIEKQNIEEE